MATKTEKTTDDVNGEAAVANTPAARTSFRLGETIKVKAQSGMRVRDMSGGFYDDKVATEVVVDTRVFKLLRSGDLLCVD